MSGLRSVHPAALAACLQVADLLLRELDVASGAAPSPARVVAAERAGDAAARRPSRRRTAPSRAEGELQALTARGLGLLRALALEPLLAAPLLFLLPVSHGG